MNAEEEIRLIVVCNGGAVIERYGLIAVTRKDHSNAATALEHRFQFAGDTHRYVLFEGPIRPFGPRLGSTMARIDYDHFFLFYRRRQPGWRKDG